MFYTYSAKHKVTGEWYYGVRCSKNATLTDLGVRYWSSSRVVWSILQVEGEDIFEWKVRRVFTTAKAAITHETKLLNRVNAAGNTKFINRHNGGLDFRAYWNTISDEVRKALALPNIQKAQAGCKKYWLGLSKEERLTRNKKAAEAAAKVTKSVWDSTPPAERHNLPVARGWRKWWASSPAIQAKKVKELTAGLRKKRESLTDREKEDWYANAAAKNRERVTCEYCDKTPNRGMYARWHGEKCRWVRKFDNDVLTIVKTTSSPIEIENACLQIMGYNQYLFNFRKLQREGKIWRAYEGYPAKVKYFTDPNAK
jgi:hypothetical protein